MNNFTNRNFSEIEKPTFSSAKPIVNCQLSIVHYPLLILLCLLFAGSLSAQDNYSVIVKCPVISGQTGYMGVTFSTNKGAAATTYASAYGWSGSGALTANVAGKLSNYKTSNSTKSTTYVTYTISSGNINAYNQSSYKGTGTSSVWWNGGIPGTASATGHWTSSTFKKSTLGYANFNISAVPSFISSVNGATMTLKDASSLTHQFSIYGLKTIPTSNNAANWAYLTNATSNGQYQNYSFTGTSSYTLGMWNTGTATYNSSVTVQSRSSLSSVSSNTWSYKFFQDITSLRANNITSMGMMFSAYGYTGTTCSFNVPSSNISLNVQYQAPWSKVLSPSAKVPATSACATGGTYTLTASQSMNTSYVSVSPQTWTWYSATASGGPYASIGTTTASAYTVSGRNDPGTVWYRYAEKASMVSNTARSTVTNYYTIGTNLCSPAKIEFKCTPLPSNPTFSATATGDRSVTLTWSGISGTDHYVIRYGVDSGISFKEITVPYGTNTVTIENLTNGREYYFQIQAIGGIEASGCQYCTTQLSTKAHVTPDCDE